MTVEKKDKAAAAAPAPAAAEGVEPSSEATESTVVDESGGEGAEVADGDGTPGGAAAGGTEEAATEPPAPTQDKLTTWSQKLSRKKVRLDQREGRIVERERTFEQQQAEARRVLALLDTDPRELLDRIAERRGTTRAKIYEQWMQDELRAGTPEEKLAKLEADMQRDRAERQKAQEAEQRRQQEAQVHNWAREVHTYVGTTLETSKHDYLKAYPKADVATRCASLILAELQRTGIEVSVDEMLSRMNNATKADYELHQRQREGAAQVPHSEQNGAVQSAQPASRKRAVTNAHAAAKATPDDEDEDDISDAALKRKSAEALRRTNTGWR